MRLLGYYLLVMLVCSILDLPTFLTKLSDPFHKFCLDWSVSWGEFYHVALALSCGSKKSSLQIFETFKHLGLVHLLVISGAHLALLEKFLTRIKTPQLGVGFFLLCFTFMSGANPPVVRAFGFYSFHLINKKFRLFYSPLESTIISSALIVCLLPTWWGSLSFLMSVLASLLVHSHKTSFLRLCTRMYLGLIPVLIFLGIPHPLSILINWIFTPIFTVLLFPLSLLAYFWPLWGPIANTAWIWTHEILTQIPLNMLTKTLPFKPLWMIGLWGYVLFLAYWSLKTTKVRVKNSR